LLHLLLAVDNTQFAWPSRVRLQAKPSRAGALVVDARDVHVRVGAQDLHVAAAGDVGALAQRDQLAQLVAVGPQVVVEDAGRARVRQHIRVARLRLVRREGPVLLRAVCAQQGAQPCQAQALSMVDNKM